MEIVGKDILGSRMAQTKVPLRPQACVFKKQTGEEAKGAWGRSEGRKGPDLGGPHEPG